MPPLSKSQQLHAAPTASKMQIPTCQRPRFTEVKGISNKLSQPWQAEDWTDVTASHHILCQFSPHPRPPKSRGVSYMLVAPKMYLCSTVGAERVKGFKWQSVTRKEGWLIGSLVQKGKDWAQLLKLLWIWGTSTSEGTISHPTAWLQRMQGHNEARKALQHYVLLELKDCTEWIRSCGLSSPSFYQERKLSRSSKSSCAAGGRPLSHL